MENYLRYIICKELLKIFFIEFNVKLKKIGTFVRYIICSTKKMENFVRYIICKAKKQLF